MKNKLFAFVALLLCLYLSNDTIAKTPSWLWARNGTGPGEDYAFATATDHKGNVYVAGRFIGATLALDNITLTNASELSNKESFFIVKYDPNGNVLWTKSDGSTGYNQINGIATDAMDNVYMTGTYSNSISIGNTTLSCADADEWNIFCAKLDPDGQVLWARSDGGTKMDVGFNIVADNWGNVYVTGQFESPVLSFGADSIINPHNSTAPGSVGDIFIVKYNGSGNEVWARSAGGDRLDIPYDIALDKSGAVYITGGFQSSSITFGDNTFTNTSQQAPQYFVAKYDNNGTVLWAKTTTNPKKGSIVGNSIATDADDNVYVTGNYDDSIVTFGNTTLVNAGNYFYSSDMFLVKYNAGGDVIWAKSAGGSHSDGGCSLALDSNGNVYIAGYLAGPSVHFDNTVITDQETSKADMFIAKYLPDGSIDWVNTGGGHYGYIWVSIAINNQNNIFVAGNYAGSMTLGNTTLPDATGTNIFVAKMGNQGTVIQQSGKAQVVQVYPNPGNGKFHINIPGSAGYDLDNLQLKIYNNLGQCVYQAAITNLSTDYDLSSLAKGIYFYQLQNEGKISEKGRLTFE